MFDIWLHAKRFFCFHTKTYRKWTPYPGWQITCLKCGKTRNK